jgi:hypothetical protein
MPTLSASHLTPAARAWLAGAGPARVLNVFDRACNLVDGAGQVLAIVTRPEALAPFGLAVAAANGASPFAGLSEDSPIAFASGALHLGPLVLEHAAASHWDPRPDWVALGTALSAEPSRVAELARLVAVRRPERPGSLLDLFLAPADASPLPPGLLSRARAAMADLTAGLLTGQPEQTLAGAIRLAGLGGGLTPAGDDFAVGACLASWAGLYGPAAQSLGPVIAQAMLPATTSLSAAYIHSAVRGECAAPWHALFTALLQPATQPRRPPGPSRALSSAVNTLLTLGHTSGADGLAGFLAPYYLTESS